MDGLMSSRVRSNLRTSPGMTSPCVPMMERIASNWLCANPCRERNASSASTMKTVIVSFLTTCSDVVVEVGPTMGLAPEKDRFASIIFSPPLRCDGIEHRLHLHLWENEQKLLTRLVGEFLRHPELRVGSWFRRT